MAPIVVVLVGALLIVLVFAMEGGVLRLPSLRRRREPRRNYEPYEPYLELSGGEDQCVATTADGQQCVRTRASRHTRYCWQHQRMAQEAELSQNGRFGHESEAA